MIKLITAACLALILLASCSRNEAAADGAAEDAVISSYAIAYNVLTDEGNDNYDIFSMQIDGSDPVNITEGFGGVEWTYYAYADKLFLISDKDTCHRCYFLYETDARGSAFRRVYDKRLADSWMSGRADGGELIVKPHPEVDTAFHIIDLDGNLVQRLAVDLPFYSDPLFVHEGSQVIFRGGSTRSKLIDGFDEALYLVNTDGTGLLRLTHYPEDDTTAGKFGYRAGPPRLHPTEDFISYQSKQKNKYSLFAVSLEGGNSWKLTDNPQNEGWHAWSPDGRWLAIELFDDGQTQFHIGLMNRESGNMDILTDTAYRYQQAPNFVLRD